jgi:hypothetical protein
MTSHAKELGISYLWHKAISDKEKARLSLELLLENGVGIGDHSTGDFYKNLDEALDLLVDSNDRLGMLETCYGEGDASIDGNTPISGGEAEANT